jgi:hypothetical protein
MLAVGLEQDGLLVVELLVQVELVVEVTLLITALVFLELLIEVVAVELLVILGHLCFHQVVQEGLA